MQRKQSLLSTENLQTLTTLSAAYYYFRHGTKITGQQPDKLHILDGFINFHMKNNTVTVNQ